MAGLVSSVAGGKGFFISVPEPRGTEKMAGCRGQFCWLRPMPVGVKQALH